MNLLIYIILNLYFCLIRTSESGAHWQSYTYSPVKTSVAPFPASFPVSLFSSFLPSHSLLSNTKHLPHLSSSSTNIPLSPIFSHHHKHTSLPFHTTSVSFSSTTFVFFTTPPALTSRPPILSSSIRHPAPSLPPLSFSHSHSPCVLFPPPPNTVIKAF